jgi:hypothetical protein
LERTSCSELRSVRPARARSVREVARPAGELTAGLFFEESAVSGALGEKPKRARGRVGGVSGGVLGAEVRSENVERDPVVHGR